MDNKMQEYTEINEHVIEFVTPDGVHVLADTRISLEGIKALRASLKAKREKYGKAIKTKQ
ncbi:hypothetical protein [Caballeronia temeraria]|nr:hypothetical protein [Caballeronia temeraria]